MRTNFFYTRTLYLVFLVGCFGYGSTLQASLSLSNFSFLGAIFKGLSWKKSLETKIETFTKLIKQEHEAKTNTGSVTFAIVNPNSWGVPKELRSQRIIAVTNITFGSLGKKTARMYFSDKMKYLDGASQIQVILHELAHAYDSNFGVYNFDDSHHTQNFYLYPHIKDEVERYLEAIEERNGFRVEVLSYEWHAEWQSLQWMKKHAPKQVQAFKAHLYKRRDRERQEGIDSYRYPPAEIMLKWI